MGNYEEEWVLQRKKGNKLYLYRVPKTQDFPCSYSMFRIPYTEFISLISMFSWEELDTDSFVSENTLSENGELKCKFYDLAKMCVPKSTRQEVTKKVETDVYGTSCLVRSSNYSSIQIAFRKGRNITQINRVCIPDNVRERFFESCRRTNDPLATVYYKIRNGYDEFEYWSDYMNKEYIRQVSVKNES